MAPPADAAVNNDPRDFAGIVGRASSIVLGALVIERGVTAYFGQAWGAAAAIGLAGAVFVGVWWWSRRRSK